MDETVYFIDGEWLTWTQAHNLGLTKQPAEMITVCDNSRTMSEIKRDSSDGTFYDSSTHPLMLLDSVT